VLAEDEIRVPFDRARGYEAIEGREVDLFGATVRECVSRTSLR